MRTDTFYDIAGVAHKRDNNINLPSFTYKLLDILFKFVRNFHLLRKRVFLCVFFKHHEVLLSLLRM